MSRAKFGFSVWGRKENIQIYPFLESILERHGLGPQVKPTKTNYDLAINADILKQEMEQIGFINVKMWFQPVNFVFNTFEDFFDTIFNQPATAMKIQTLTLEQQKALIEDARREYVEQFEKAVEPKHFENMIIIASRP